MEITVDFIFYISTIFLLALFFGYTAIYFYNKASSLETSPKNNKTAGKHHHNVILTFVFGTLSFILYYTFIVTSFEALDKSRTEYACISGFIHSKGSKDTVFFLEKKFQDKICKAFNKTDKKIVYNDVILEKLYHEGRISLIGIKDKQTGYPIYVAKGLITEIPVSDK